MGLPGQVRNLRNSYRVRYNAEEMANGFALFSLASEALRSLVVASKSWGVTVNDILLALLMKSLDSCTSGRKQARRRRKLSVGCIVNARKDLGVDSERVFGLFLGSFTVTHEVPEGIALRQLAEAIRDQTSRVKRHKLYLASPLELGFGRFMLKFFSPRKRRTFYAKYYPLWGGITNMNLNSLWDQKSATAPLDYFRGVSTGPITPLVLSVSTVGQRLNLGVCYRTAVFRSEDIERFESRLREQLEETRR